jgi:hypothetical protein
MQCLPQRPPRSRSEHHAEQRAPSRQVAKHGWRLDERGLHLFLQGLGDGLGEHLGILTAWGSLPGACGGGSSVVNRGRHSAACLSTESGSPLARPFP